MNAHHCHAEGCTTNCKPEYLMCPRHWRQVPRRLQLAVLKHYRPGQCDDKGVSIDWLIAAHDAINAVAGRTTDPTVERLREIKAKRTQDASTKEQA